MDGASEYRDAWRGLRILVPAGWQVRRSGPGLFLHAATGRQVVIVQPRPGPRSVEQLEQDLAAWLERLDPRARLQPEPGAPSPVRFFTATVVMPPGEEAIGLFAAQAGRGGGLITGFLAPATDYDAASPVAIGALASLAALPAQARRPWREPVEGACTALVPEGWLAEGTIQSAPAQGLPTIEFRARSSDGMEAMAATSGRLSVEPGLLSGLLGGLSGGLVGRGRFVDAAAYAEAQLLPALRQEVPSARIEAVIARPDLIAAGAAQEAAASGIGVEQVLQGQPSAADVVFWFERDGREMRRVSRVLTMRVPASLAHGLPLWMALTPYTYQAPADRMAAWEPVLEGVCLSFQVDAMWKHRWQAELAAEAGLHAPGAPSDGTPLVGKAESLLAASTGRPLAAHERPFLIAPESIECPADLADLYNAGVWPQQAG